jgi:hypothetical protein
MGYAGELQRSVVDWSIVLNERMVSSDHGFLSRSAPLVRLEFVFCGRSHRLALDCTELLRWWSPHQI